MFAIKMKTISKDDNEARSMNIVKENRNNLEVLFPEVFTEDGINYVRLRQILGDEN